MMLIASTSISHYIRQPYTSKSIHFQTTTCILPVRRTTENGAICCYEAKQTGMAFIIIKYSTNLFHMTVLLLRKLYAGITSWSSKSKNYLEQKHKNQCGNLCHFCDVWINKQLDPCIPVLVMDKQMK